MCANQKLILTLTMSLLAEAENVVRSDRFRIGCKAYHCKGIDQLVENVPSLI
jgi:hypothetical protein